MDQLYKKIEMRTDCDCMVACLAMLLQCDYETAAQFFPAIAINKKGYNWEYLTPFLKANGIYLSWMPTKNEVNWNKPAMLDVASLTAPEKGEHIIFWDGKQVIDPSRKELKYTELPFEINCGYQINERWTKLPVKLPVPFTPDIKAVIMPTPGEVYKEAEWRATNGHGALDDYSMSIFINACEWFRSQVREVELKERIYDIDCNGYMKIQVSVKDNILTVLQAMNGYGDREDISTFNISVDDYLSARKEGE